MRPVEITMPHVLTHQSVMNHIFCKYILLVYSCPVMILVIILYLHTTVLPFPTADSRCQGRRQQGECRALLLVVAVGLESIKIL